MAKQYLRLFKVALFLVLGLLVLWWITKDQDLNKLSREFTHAKYFWVLVAAVLAILSHYARALRWKVLIQTLGYRPKKSETFRAVMSGYLANMLVPRMGEISKCAVLSKSSKIPFNSLAGTMIAERVFDLVTLFVLLIFTFLFQFHFLKDFLFDLLVVQGSENHLPSKILLIGGSIMFLAFGLLLATMINQKIKTSESGTFWGKVKSQIEGLFTGVKTLWKTDAKLLFLFYTFLIWFLYFMVVYVVFLAIESTTHLGASAGITLLAIGSLGFIAPVPGGIGAYHFVTIAALTKLYGIGQESATSYAYISHAMQMLSIIFISAGLWLLVAVRSRKQNNSPAQSVT